MTRYFKLSNDHYKDIYIWCYNENEQMVGRWFKTPDLYKGEWHYDEIDPNYRSYAKIKNLGKYGKELTEQQFLMELIK